MVNIKSKKHLGQHFLKNPDIAKQIVESIVDREGRVFEIGPGMGILTQFLIEQKREFMAMDVDKDSIDYLRHKYSNYKNCFVLGDFLQMGEGLLKNGDILLGNFPYNISSQLFFSIYNRNHQVKEVVCMTQKEVAERICSSPGNRTYGILSVLLQAFYSVEYLFTVEANNFVPPPKVLSAVIRLRRNSINKLNCDENLFKRLVKEGFGKRRKTLRNALNAFYLPDSIKKEEVFGKRAEQLSVKDYVKLARQISKHKISNGI